MPNHISNALYFRYDPDNGAQREHAAEDYQKLQEMVKTKKSRFDFNAIIPTPEYVYQGDLPSDWKPSGKYTVDWYTWNTEHWGTKWNAYSVHVGPEEICFYTAWDCPRPVIEAISRQFPDSKLVLEYADAGFEDTPCILVYRNGTLIEGETL